MEKIIEEFSRHFFKKKYKHLKLEYIDDNKVIVYHNKLKLKITIPFNKSVNFDEIKNKIKGYTVKNRKVFHDFSNTFEWCLNYEEINKWNPKLKIFSNKGYKIDDVVELLVAYSDFNYESRDWYYFDSFFIKDVKVNIEQPSDIFRIIFKEYEGDKYIGDFDSYMTITLKGIDSNNYKDTLQQVMFWMYQINPSFDLQFPQLSELFLEDSQLIIDAYDDSESKKIFKNEYENKKFASSKYPEPIHFYNAAKRVNDRDISFLYFYKILEFYFIISQKESVKDLIQQYNINSDINSFMNTMFNEYFGKKENLLLKQLLHTLPNKFISEICTYCFNVKIIPEDSIDVFADTLYKYRNSIVHGKYEFKTFSLKTPDIIDDENSKEWALIIEKIGFQLILKYCYEK